MLRSVKSPQRLVRELHFEVDGTGTAALTSGGQHGTLVDNGTGDYTITYANAANRVMGAQVTCKTADLNATVSATTTAVTVLTTDNADSATDADFYLTVTLADSADET